MPKQNIPRGVLYIIVFLTLPHFLPPKGDLSEKDIFSHLLRPHSQIYIIYIVYIMYNMLYSVHIFMYIRLPGRSTN